MEEIKSLREIREKIIREKKSAKQFIKIFEFSNLKTINMEAENYFEAMEYIREVVFSTVSSLPLSIQMLAGSSMAVGAYKMLVNAVPGKVPVVAIINLEGVIAAGGGGSPNPLMKATNINLDGIKGAVDSAFSQQNLKLVCLVINSPGGSPVQSDLVYR